MNLGLDLADWTRLGAVAVSAKGSTVVGFELAGVVPLLLWHRARKRHLQR